MITSYKIIAIREFWAKKLMFVIQHLPYSLDLSPCDYFLFLKIKIVIKETLYATLKSYKPPRISHKGHPKDGLPQIHLCVDSACPMLYAEKTYIQSVPF